MEWTAVISALAALSGLALGWIGRARAISEEVANEADRDATMRSDLLHIKHGIDDMRIDLRAQGQRFDILSERVTRVEESCKQAHHRLNRYDGGDRRGVDYDR